MVKGRFVVDSQGQLDKLYGLLTDIDVDSVVQHRRDSHQQFNSLTNIVVNVMPLASYTNVGMMDVC